ncbi:hypothetical protein [Parasphingorhabdus sp.]|uniref:hypothetical protein n=1 Tax=Parasphingorhabdus sp. TaxID=2709688 RepID=UPI0032652428
MQWYEIKIWLEQFSGLDRDSLHIYAGVAIQLVVALFCRRSLASPIPWLFVVAIALANEYYDSFFVPDMLIRNRLYFDEAVRDMWNTLLLPSLFLVIARFFPNWLTGKAAVDGPHNESQGSNADT